MRKILLIGISTFALGAAAMAYADQQSKTPKAETYKMLELFGDVLATVEDQYVVPVDDKKLIQSAIDGMLTSLDPHSGYLDAENFDEMRDQTRAEYASAVAKVRSMQAALDQARASTGRPEEIAAQMAGAGGAKFPTPAVILTDPAPSRTAK